MFASFFFWKPGFPLQKSLDGLYRGLLHHVLSSNSELIPEVLSDEWKRIQSTPWQLREKVKFRPQETLDAFKRRIGNDAIYKSHCFCFFADGLDEYEPAIDKDFPSVVNMLKKWTTENRDSVKTCMCL